MVGEGFGLYPVSSDSYEEPDSAKDDWKPHELKLRRQEVKTQRFGTKVQAAGSAAALIAGLAAAFAAVQAGKAVGIASEGIQRQADENRLSTSVAAIGGNLSPERVAGFTILRRHVETMMDRSLDDGANPRERRDALSLYESSLDIFENYLKNPAPITRPRAPSRGGNAALGAPQSPAGVRADVVYAANELRALLDLKKTVRRLSVVEPPDKIFNRLAALRRKMGAPRLPMRTLTKIHERATRLEERLVTTEHGPMPKVDLSKCPTAGAIMGGDRFRVA
jgi:hypothetical protein